MLPCYTEAAQATVESYLNCQFYVKVNLKATVLKF